MPVLRVGLQTLRRLLLPGPTPELNVYVQALDEAMHPSQVSPVPRHSTCRHVSNQCFVQHRRTKVTVPTNSSSATDIARSARELGVVVRRCLVWRANTPLVRGRFVGWFVAHKGCKHCGHLTAARAFQRPRLLASRYVWPSIGAELNSDYTQIA